MWYDGYIPASEVMDVLEHKKGLLMAALGAAMWGGSGVAGQ